MAKHEMRVGHRRLLASRAVTGRSGHCAGTGGTDGQRTVRQPRNRAATRTDGHHVHHRQRQRPLADPPVLREPDLPAAKQADVRTGAADIDRDDVANAASRGCIARTNDAGGRTGQHRENRCLADRGRSGDAAVRLHQQQRRCDVGIGQAALQTVHIGGDGGHHAGIHDRGQAALVFAHDGQHIHRRGHRHVRQCITQHRRHAPLVRGIRERVQQTDRDSLHIEPAQRGGNFVHAGFVQRNEHDATGTDALGHLQHARRRNGALRLHPRKEVGVARNVLSSDLQHMSEAGRGHQSGARRLFLENQIGGDRRPVQHSADCIRIRASVGQDKHHAGKERFRRIGRCARDLGAPQKSGRTVGERDVGERAADIHRDGKVSRWHRHSPCGGKPSPPVSWRGERRWLACPPRRR